MDSEQTEDTPAQAAKKIKPEAPPANKTKATEPPSNPKPVFDAPAALQKANKRIDVLADRINKLEENMRRLYERNHMQMP